MPSLLLALIIALLQWLVTEAFSTDPSFNHTLFLYGNLQIIVIIWIYQTFNKYIKLN
jgi:hypothetical protein